MGYINLQLLIFSRSIFLKINPNVFTPEILVWPETCLICVFSYNFLPVFRWITQGLPSVYICTAQLLFAAQPPCPLICDQMERKCLFQNWWSGEVLQESKLWPKTHNKEERKICNYIADEDPSESTIFFLGFCERHQLQLFTGEMRIMESPFCFYK